MAVETVTHISDLVVTNPLPGDARGEGDDHLRNLKVGLKTTLPNATRPFYFPRAAAKTADYTVLVTDLEKIFPCDATADHVDITLPTLTTANDGWCCRFVKTDATANQVRIAGTINGETNLNLKKQYEAVNLYWTGTAWLAFRPLVVRDGVVLLPIGTTATRPGTPLKGGLWYNDTTSNLEYTNGTDWFPLLVSLVGANLGSGAIINGTLSESRAGNATTFALKTLAGTDPSATDKVLLAFRNSTLATGNYVYRTVEAALSITITSGSTLGFTSSVGSKLWVVLFDDGGTIRMGVINCLSGNNIYPLGRVPRASSTAEGGLGAADSAHVFYTGTAVSNKAYLVLGSAYYEAGLTAGAWGSAPTILQLWDGGKLPGDVLQTKSAENANYTGLTTLLPYDNTVPTIAEGDEIFSESFTMTSAAHLLRAKVGGMGACNGGGFFALAIFEGSTCKRAGGANSAANEPVRIEEGVIYCPDSSAELTMSVRGGPNSGAITAYLNGISTGRKFGGAASWTFELDEIVT